MDVATNGGSTWPCPACIVKANLNCPICEGKGSISEEKRQWMTAGMRLQEDRVRRQMSLKEEANRLGMSVMDLATMERGMRKPYTLENQDG